MSNVINLPSSKFAGIEDIKPGAIIYDVTAVPNYKTGLVDAWISKKKILNWPYRNLTLGLFCEYESTSTLSKKPHKSKFALGDCNIPQNNYNAHRLFTSMESAKEYVKHIQDPSQWTVHEASIMKKWMNDQAREAEINLLFPRKWDE